MDKRLEIFTLGAERILLGGQPVKSLRKRKAEALLIYLASTCRPQSREVLADLLWDERTQSQALANLRGILTILRWSLGGFLSISRDVVAINPAAMVWLDALQMENGLRELHQQGRLNPSTAGQVTDALALYRGEFLEGFSLNDCRRFEEWQLRERERLHYLAIDGLSELVAYDIRRRDYQLGMVHAARLLELDPLMEAAHRHMMLLLANCGQRAAALSQFETCRKLLYDELGVVPAEETRDLYQQIHAGKLPGMEGQYQVSPPSVARPGLDNLPLQLTTFIGREEEIKALRKLLSNSRMVTLTGSAGVGKTRLALEVCKGLLSAYPEGVWLVDLAPLTDPQYILPAITAGFNLQEQSSRPLLQVLLDYLQAKNLLLVLDNCEHLVTPIAQLVESLLTHTPEIRILATSREALNLAGEVPYLVPSLSLPDVNTSTPEAVDQSEAGRLFMDRASIALPNFTLTPDNAPTIAQICHRLDGIPLAVELAAARVKLLGVQQIATRLEHDISLLAGGSRTALPKQKTLRATIDWSYNLFSEQERILFRRLSVFPGYWDLEAAENICCDREGNLTSISRIRKEDILDLLSDLVKKSMVLVDRQIAADTRYRFLVTTRQYAWEKLSESNEGTAFRKRHLEYYLNWSEETIPGLPGAEQDSRLEWVELNTDNLRMALVNGVELDPTSALRLATAVLSFWARTIHRLEGIHWLETCLQMPENSARTIYRGRALCVLADYCNLSMDYQVQWDRAREALDICQEQDDLFGQAYAHSMLGYYDCFLNKDLNDARAEFDISLEVFRAIGYRWWEAHTLRLYEEVFEDTGEISSAIVYIKQSLKIYQELKDDEQVATCLYYLGFVIGEFEGQLRRGRELYEQALAIKQRHKPDYTRAYIYQLLACLSLWQGDFTYADALNNNVSEYFTRTGDIYQALLANEFAGRLLAFQGLYGQSIELLNQSIGQFKIKFPAHAELWKNCVIPTIAYALANQGQVKQAKRILGQLDRSLPTSLFDSRMLPRVSGLLAFLEGDAAETAHQYREWLQKMHRSHYRVGEILALEACAGALLLLGHQPEAVQCLATASAFRVKIGAHIWPGDLPIHDRVRNDLLAQLGESDFQKYWRLGESLSLQRATKLALFNLE